MNKNDSLPRIPIERSDDVDDGKSVEQVLAVQRHPVAPALVEPGYHMQRVFVECFSDDLTGFGRKGRRGRHWPAGRQRGCQEDVLPVDCRNDLRPTSRRRRRLRRRRMNVDVQPPSRDDRSRLGPLRQLLDHGLWRAALPYPVKGDGRQSRLVLHEDHVERTEVNLGERVVVGGRENERRSLGQVRNSRKALGYRQPEVGSGRFFGRRNKTRMVADFPERLDDVGDGDGVAPFKGEPRLRTREVVVVELPLRRKHGEGDHLFDVFQRELLFFLVVVVILKCKEQKLMNTKANNFVAVLVRQRLSSASHPTAQVRFSAFTRIFLSM